MKKLYYFTNKNLRFTEIKRIKTKLVLLIAISFLILSSSGFYLINKIAPFKPLSSNSAYQNQIVSLITDYQKVSIQLDSLIKVNNELRIAANLQPISNEVRELGVGGGEFNLSIDYLKSSESSSLKQVDFFVDKLLTKIKFEKQNIDDISSALTRNELLFKDIPAIKPCNGTLGAHGFGMRLHPILHVIRMHNGIDIITNVGTPVYASGGGLIDFVGVKNGFGLCVEIDHGFGYRTIYAHLSGTKVKQGQKVERNVLIAFTGNTGLSAGPHLHYEVLHDGINLDPEQFFFDDSRLFANN
ncbi:MAG: M23 family metallopeptidase [Ignavibacteriaceae bacterium]